MLKFCIIGAVFCGCVLGDDDRFTMIGDAYEAGSPCRNDILEMERIIGGPPSKENYWDGTIDLGKIKNLQEARIKLRLTAPATVTLDEEDGRLMTDDDVFYMTLYRKWGGTYRGKFRVQGRPKGDFPNVAGLWLNGKEICEDFEPWKPALLGAGNVGDVDLRSQADSTEDSTTRSSTCGRRIIRHQGLVTNGYPTQEGDWPWHAAIFHIDSGVSKYRCGGTLISTKAVVTACHCTIENTQQLVPSRVLVRLGQHNRLFANANTKEYRVRAIVAHEDFNSGDLRNDIALLKLTSEVAFTDYIQPACLWDVVNDLNDVIDEEGQVIGWGYNENDELSDILMQAKMPVVSLTTCLNSNRGFFGNYLSDMNYCAGFRNGTSVCNGDSGGGMFFKRNGVYRLRGLVSLSVSRDDKNLCDTKHYVIFTDCAKFTRWIQANLLDA